MRATAKRAMRIGSNMTGNRPKTDAETTPEKLQRLIATEIIVLKQADDYDLWCVAETEAEECLQRALRRLHAAIEGETFEQ